jgi:hypothetical protein
MMTIVDSKGLDRADTMTLHDGAVVLLRRLDAHDAKAVEAFHSDLTDRDRYYRFFVIHPGFLHRFASKLLENSPTNYAIGVFVALFVLAALGLRPESGVPADRRAWRRGGTRRHPAHNPTAHPMPRGLFLPRRLIGDMFARREVAGHRMARASRNARFREICDAGCVCCLALPIEYVSEELPLRLSLSSQH